MKAKINSKGGLEIYAENGLEAFALQIWHDDYNKEGGSKYTLLIDCVSYEQEGES